jgi:4-amino-4-deoxy-L-arabinose transferase-like glycosyltransferase
MVLSGDWLSPQIYGIYWYDKPIAIYWLLSLSYSIFGFTDFASRLPGAVFGMASVLITAWYVLRRTGKTLMALLAAAMLATSLEVWAISHSIITDQILFFFTAGTMFFAYIGLTEGKCRYMTAAYAMAAGAVLAKGPVGIVLPGLFLLIFAAVRRNSTYFKRIFSPSGILVFCLLALPWYGSMYALHGQDFIDGFLGLNNVVRATVSEHPQMNVWYYYVILVPVSLLPWTGPCLYAFWRRRGWTDEYLFMTIWALGTILFYSFMATKYPTYSYIANIPLLFLGTLGIMDIYETDRRKLWTIVTAPAICYWALLFAASFFVQWGNWLWLYIFVPLAIAMVIFSQWRRSYPAIPALIAIATIIVYGIVTQQGLSNLYQYRSTAVVLPAQEHMQGDLYFYGDYRTSFVYYSGRSAALLEMPGTDKNALLHRSNVWSKKHLYKEADPWATVDRLTRHEALSIIVAEKDYKEFQTSPYYSLCREAGKYGTYYLFVSP